MPRYLFYPLATDTPEDLKAQHHAEILLGSDDFTAEILKKECARGARGSKREMAATLSASAKQDSELCTRLALAYALQPKTWLTVFHGSIQQGLRARPAAEFVTSHGGDTEWFGPLEHEGALFYIYTRSVPQWFSETEGAKPSRRFLRWTCVVQVTTSWVALHWDNISYRDDKDDFARPEAQYPYWNEIPQLIPLLQDRLQTTLTPPNLLRAVLTGAWNAYEDHSQSEWTHEKIRAEAHGVALSASGKRQEDFELDASGVQALTQVLAEVAVGELGAASSEVPRVARRMLHTLIHRWNPKSYQFRLEISAAAQPAAPTRFRGHVYFGTGHFAAHSAGEPLRRTGVDGLAHVKCFAEYGGSTDALLFLLQFLMDAR
jgi:hypothetical protein